MLFYLIENINHVYYMLLNMSDYECSVLPFLVNFAFFSTKSRDGMTDKKNLINLKGPS